MAAPDFPVPQVPFMTIYFPLKNSQGQEHIRATSQAKKGRSLDRSFKMPMAISTLKLEFSTTAASANQ